MSIGTFFVLKVILSTMILSRIIFGELLYLLYVQILYIHVTGTLLVFPLCNSLKQDANLTIILAKIKNVKQKRSVEQIAILKTSERAVHNCWIKLLTLSNLSHLPRISWAFFFTLSQNQNLHLRPLEDPFLCYPLLSVDSFSRTRNHWYRLCSHVWTTLV